ncbi:MAG: dTDP-glucose 4,6-dehydratase [Patescibacteria group bacterium]
MAKKILITGGAGFIGTNFAYYMANKHPHDDLVVLDKLTYAGNKNNLTALIKSGKARFIKGDIANKKFITALFKKEKFDVVVNFAAETHVDRSIVLPAVFVMTNVVGTHNLLEASREFGAPRYHQISTDEVYGDLGRDSKDFFTEDTPLAPTSPYSSSKAASDLLVQAYFKTYGLFATISRCSNNYGPYQFPEKLIPFFFKLARSDKPLPLYGDGKNIRDWLFVEDHCEAIDLILQKASPGAIYNIGGNTERNNIEIAHLILEFLKKPRTLIKYVKDRLAHDQRYAIDSSKIKKELGWKPRTSFENGIKLTFEWYKNNKYL